MLSHPVTDLSLAQRLERAEGRANAASVEARARRSPDVGALWQDFGGTFAMFDGPSSPLTQTFGLGLFAPPTHEALEEIERFFFDRGAPVFHETSPIADVAILSLLPERGYRPVEQSAVLFQGLAGNSLPPLPSLRTRPIAAGEEAMWAEGAARGWGEHPELADFIREFGLITAASRGAHCFVVEIDDEVVATGALAIHEGVALLAGASTRPEFRGRGAQAALLASRLHFAVEQGCELAMMAAAPGSSSQRNAERKGFRIGYTRTKWGKTGG